MKISENEFYENSIIQLGLLKMLENIGEAAYQISRATKSEFTSLELDKIIAARHVYVHDYFKIDWIKIWVSLNTIDFYFLIEETGKIIDIFKKRLSIE